MALRKRLIVSVLIVRTCTTNNWNLTPNAARLWWPSGHVIGRDRCRTIQSWFINYGRRNSITIIPMGRVSSPRWDGRCSPAKWRAAKSFKLHHKPVRLALLQWLHWEQINVKSLLLIYLKQCLHPLRFNSASLPPFRSVCLYAISLQNQYVIGLPCHTSIYAASNFHQTGDKSVMRIDYSGPSSFVQVPLHIQVQCKMHRNWKWNGMPGK